MNKNCEIFCSENSKTKLWKYNLEKKMDFFFISNYFISNFVQTKFSEEIFFQTKINFKCLSASPRQ